MITKDLPLGVRLNNPGNLEWGSPWQGMVPKEESMYAKTGNTQQKRFVQFKSPADGIRAIARTLITYQDKRTAKDGSRIDTVREIIERWAPANENNVDAYTTAVRRAVFGDSRLPVQYLDVHDYTTMRRLVEGIIRHENGPGPLNNVNSWYDDATIDEGLRRAGVLPDQASMPVTKEVVGATTTGAGGAAILADTLPSVVTAIKDSEDHLSSGSVVRTVIGVALVIAAAVIAYSQVKRYRAGAL